MARKKAGKKGVKKKASEKRSEEEVCEIFEVKGGKGKEKIVKACGTVDSPKPTKEQIDYENKLLRNMLIIFGLFVLVILIGYFTINSIRHFEYEGAKFDVVKEGDLIFYSTTIPVMFQGEARDYNFYFRNDPRKLDSVISIEDKIDIRKNIVLDVTTENLFCEGDWNLAIGTLQKLNVFGINLLVKNESESYEPEDDYMFLTINEGNTTEIKKTGDYSYEMNINNCEILPAAEKLVIDVIVEYNRVNKQA